MVRTSWPSAMTASVVQDLTALPSRWTTQAPHCEVSQPTWVPVSRRFSRRNWTRRVRGSILAFTGLPFTIREILAISTLLSCTAAYRLRRRLKSFQGHNMGHPGNEQPWQSLTSGMARCGLAGLLACSSGWTQGGNLGRPRVGILEGILEGILGV